MANKRRDGWKVSTYSAPADLIAAAAAAAAREGVTVSEVIRAALTRYVKDHPPAD